LEAERDLPRPAVVLLVVALPLPVDRRGRVCRLVLADLLVEARPELVPVG
jgi:hypothetical protein